MTVEVAAVRRPDRRHVANAGGYRPDIDGLRAVAIALVVAFHFGVPGFGGGYLGVDLFFVISGFLIASIFERHPLASWADLFAFYARRFKRLMPAFVFVAAVTVLVSTVLLLPDDYESLARSVRDSLGFTANRYFGRETTGYFAANAAELPWLHTWSLSVEWQFYFAFPVVAALLRIVPTRRLRTIAWLGLIVAGAGWSIALVRTHPAEAYFSATARFFEFLLGALGASIEAGVAAGIHAGRRPGTRTNRRLSIGGIVALVGLALFFDGSTPFPGLNGLAVCLVGLALIVGGPAGSVLSRAGLPWIGRRSYAIYLWHWPVVAFCNDVQYRRSAIETIVAVASVVLLAMATHRFVEKPGMASTWGPPRTFATWWFVPFACSAALFLVVHHFQGFPGRFGPQAVHAFENTKRFASHRYDGCHDDRGLERDLEGDLERCAFGDAASPTTALLIGDSHARHFRPFLQVLAEDAHVKVYGLTDSQCPTLDGARLRPDLPGRAGCVEAIARDYALIRTHRYRYVVLAERWIGYTPTELEALDASLAAIVASGAVPVILGSAAEDGTSTKDCFFRHFKTRTALVDDCTIAQHNDFATPSKAQVAALFDRMRTKYPTLIVVDPQSVQCERGRCATVIDGTPIYTDTHHLSEFGATMLGRAFHERFGNPLAGRSPGSPPASPVP